MTEPAVSSSCTSSSSTATPKTAPAALLLFLPHELQVHLLTFLRAYDLSGLQQTCTFYANPQLVHEVVLTTAEQVYPADLTQGFSATPPLPNESALYTLAHLRNMEWLVVARVLSRPEPRSGAGFYISKSWCRTALQWLEAQQQRQQELHQQQQQQQGPGSGKKNKKLSRKQLKQSRTSAKHSANSASAANAGPPEPWPDINSDLLCCHDQLQRCSNSKSARARRRLVDKQAWKTIQKLYPNSTPLSAVQGECVHCRLELESKKRAEEERVLEMKMQRKQPLNNPVLRRFYTRTRGVPTHCLVQFNNGTNTPTELNNDSEERIYSARKRSNHHDSGVPLIPGRYYLLPRAWCQAWRRYIKTGDAIGARGGMNGNAFSSPSSQPTAPPAPDAAAMLCDAHRVPVLPPHLEAYLYGDTDQLFASTRSPSNSEVAAAGNNSNVVTPPRQQIRSAVVGMAFQELDPVTIRQLQAAGMSHAEVMAQRNAMLEFEHQRRRLQEQQQQLLLAAAAAATSPVSKQECLDRENYIVVEMLSDEEYQALEALWPGSQGYDIMHDDEDNTDTNRRTPRSSLSSNGSLRGSCDCLPCHVWFDVREPPAKAAPADTRSNMISFCTRPCRECEASGTCNMSTLSSASKKLLKH